MNAFVNICLLVENGGCLLGNRQKQLDENGELDETCRSKNFRTHKAKKLKAKKQDETEVEDIADDASDEVSDSSDFDIDLSKYKYLESTSHYDPGDRAVFKYANVVAED